MRSCIHSTALCSGRDITEYLSNTYRMGGNEPLHPCICKGGCGIPPPGLSWRQSVWSGIPEQPGIGRRIFALSSFDKNEINQGNYHERLLDKEQREAFEGTIQTAASAAARVPRTNRKTTQKGWSTPDATGCCWLAAGCGQYPWRSPQRVSFICPPLCVWHNPKLELFICINPVGNIAWLLILKLRELSTC